MYLMSRRTRINSSAGIEWATTILGRVKEVTGNDVGLWANVYSAGFGTITWTSWWADLGSMEAAFAKLQADTTYIALGAAGASLIDGGVDDSLFQTLSADPSEDSSTVEYVASVQAVCAAGNIARAMTAGIEIAEKATAIGGARTIFGSGAQRTLWTDRMAHGIRESCGVWRRSRQVGRRRRMAQLSRQHRRVLRRGSFGDGVDPLPETRLIPSETRATPRRPRGVARSRRFAEGPRSPKWQG